VHCLVVLVNPVYLIYIWPRFENINFWKNFGRKAQTEYGYILLYYVQILNSTVKQSALPCSTRQSGLFDIYMA